jgi:predicted RNase H-like HicB family nuclease
VIPFLRTMTTQRYTYWQDEEMWIGYLEAFPDYWTQGESEAELKENLADLFQDLTSGVVPNVRRSAELEIA